LTQISIFWFDKLKQITPTHFVTANIDEMPEEVRKYKDQLESRAMLVKKAKVIPLEAIVRGYLTGERRNRITSLFLTSQLRKAPAGRSTRRAGQSTGSRCLPV